MAHPKREDNKSARSSGPVSWTECTPGSAQSVCSPGRARAGGLCSFSGCHTHCRTPNFIVNSIMPHGNHSKFECGSVPRQTPATITICHRAEFQWHTKLVAQRIAYTADMAETLWANGYLKWEEEKNLVRRENSRVAEFTIPSAKLFVLGAGSSRAHGMVEFGKRRM